MEDSTFPCLFIQLLTAIHKAASACFSKDFLRLLGTGWQEKVEHDFSRGMAIAFRPSWHRSRAVSSLRRSFGSTQSSLFRRLF